MDIEDGNECMNIGIITEGLNERFLLTIPQLERHSETETKLFLPVLFLDE